MLFEQLLPLRVGKTNEGSTGRLWLLRFGFLLFGLLLFGASLRQSKVILVRKDLKREVIVLENVSTINRSLFHPSLTFREDVGVDMVSSFYDRDFDGGFRCKSDAFHSR